MSDANTVEVWCEKEFEQEFPGVREQMNATPLTPCFCCLRCCCGYDVYAQIPKVRGLLNGSTPLSDSDIKAILDVAQGKWNIQPLESGNRNTVEYQNAYVEGNKVVVSGGMHNRRQSGGMHNRRQTAFRADGHRSGITTAVANTTQTQFLHFYRAPDGKTLYCDKQGSILESYSGTEMTFNNFIGIRLKFLRDGVTPQLKMSTDPSAPPPSYNSGVLADIEKLADLRDRGMLTSAEFEEQKKKLLARI